jgi:subtilase family serine protease
MQKFAVVIGTALLISGTMLMAQAPDLNHIYAHTPIQVSTGPQNPNSPSGVLPTQFREAYGFNRIPNLGAGQTIALVDAYDDPNITSDLAFYANYFHKTPCNFQKVIVGSPLQGQGWDLEESLDVQQACALAPSANIILVEANSNSFSDLLTAVQVAYSAPYNATVVSMSWGGGEFEGENQSDSYFCNITNGNGQPVTFVAATGDGGHGTIYPSVSPCVIAAGGTSLNLTSALPGPNPLSLDYGTESAWRGSGGGISCYSGGNGPCSGGGEPEPSWQVQACAAYSPAGSRCVPDIASDANPGTGVPVYDTYSYGGWVEVGGTSVATPDWASFFTIVNSLRAAASEPLLSQAAQDLYNGYYGNNYATLFHDITTGSNGSCGAQCNAGTGYDLVTGIGSYQANNLYSVLVSDPN